MYLFMASCDYDLAKLNQSLIGTAKLRASEQLRSAWVFISRLNPTCYTYHIQTKIFLAKNAACNSQQVQVFHWVHESIKQRMALHSKK